MTMKDFRNVLLFSFIVIAYAHSQESYHNKDTTGVTAVDEYGVLDDGITIYPNPITSSEFYMNLPVELYTPQHILLFNLQGQLISELNFQKDRTGTQTLLTLPPDLLDGIYFLRINNSRGIVSNKIIVQKQLK